MHPPFAASRPPWPVLAGRDVSIRAAGLHFGAMASNPTATTRPFPLATKRTGVRLLGAFLCVAGFVPAADWLLSPERAGPAGIATAATVDALSARLWIGGLSVLLVAIGVRFLPSLAGQSRRLDFGFRRLLLQAPNPLWIVGCGIIAFVGAAAVGHLLLLGEPTLVDEMSQLADARAMAGLQPVIEAPAAAVRIQNGLMVDAGWVSIYPPGHSWILVAAMRLGFLGWIGALLWAGTVAAAADLFLRVAWSTPVAARVAGLLLALSPMGWLMGAGYLSHLSAALAITVAVSASSRISVRDADPSGGPISRKRDMVWGLVIGLAAGWAVTSRPLTGLVLGVMLPAGWILAARGRRSVRALGAAFLGGLPFAIGLGVWNQARFGTPLRFGYSAAFGPSHGLGFHMDPWGNSYGLVEAIGYTLSDLFILGATLLETPLSLVGLIGLILLLLPDSGRGRPAALAAVWILSALGANALYWHHGLHFGPRMLFETLPAWVLLLSVTAGRALVGTAETRWGMPLRIGLLAAFIGAVTLNLPARLTSAAVGGSRQAQLPSAESLAVLPDSAVIFVHGSWASRVSGRLAQAGMRADSIETALRRNDLCLVDLGARLLVEDRPGSAMEREAALNRIDWTPRPGTPDELEMVEIGPGNRVRMVQPRRSMPESCMQEIAADRLGGLELEAVKWRGGDRGIVWLRDLGPDFNPQISGAWMLAPRETGGRPELMPYTEGLGLIWSQLRVR